MDNAQLISALQTVISPVVLISGVGMLVLSMTNRFSHTTDRARLLADQRHKVDEVAREQAESQIRILYRRLRILLLAIALALGSVLLTALLIITLFANYLFDTTFRGLIVVFFVFSLLSLVSSLVLFIRDMSLSLTALQEDLHVFL
jgi:polyferredoxin